MALLDSVNRVILSSSDTPEESIRYFLKMVIDGARSVAIYGPRSKESKVFPIKNHLIERKISRIDLFVNHYLDYHARMILLWADLAKRWNRPNEIDVLELLKKEMVLFKDDLTQAFDAISDASVRHLEDIEFILRNYSDLSKAQTTLLNKRNQSLEEISQITYEKFIIEIRSNKKS